MTLIDYFYLNHKKLEKMNQTVHDLSLTLPYTVVSAVFTVFGALGNLLIIFTILVTKELQSSSSVIVFNLAVVDLAIAFFIDSFMIVSVIVGKIFYDQRPGLCTFVAVFCVILCSNSILSIVLISFNRFTYFKYLH